MIEDEASNVAVEEAASAPVEPAAESPAEPAVEIAPELPNDPGAVSPADAEPVELADFDVVDGKFIVALTDEQIAELAHAAMIAYGQIAGDTSIPTWGFLATDVQQSAIDFVVSRRTSRDCDCTVEDRMPHRIFYAVVDACL